MSIPQVSRPETTLFLSCSVDGRLTGHDADLLDPNPSWKETPGVRAILQRFYDFSDPKTSAVTSGAAMQLTGVNEKTDPPKRIKISLIVLDHTASLTPKGVRYLAECVKTLYYVGSPARLSRITARPKNLYCIPYTKAGSLRAVAQQLYTEGVRSMTVHSDGPMNARWLAQGLIDSITIVVAPLIVGGNGTPAVMPELPFDVTLLKLVETRAIDDSYLFLRYTVIPH